MNEWFIHMVGFIHRHNNLLHRTEEKIINHRKAAQHFGTGSEKYYVLLKLDFKGRK